MALAAPTALTLGASVSAPVPLGAGYGCDGGGPEGTGRCGPSPRLGESMHDVRGAVYFPARAFNSYQTWRDYDAAEVERDVGFAAALSLNALRVIVSYEFYREAPAAFERRFEHLLATADAAGVAVLPVLFESIGDQPTAERLTDRDVRTAVAVQSPASRTIRRRRRWGGPRAFVSWFVGTFGDRDAVLAVEIMNEPGRWGRRVAFCREMLRTARAADDGVPLTIGCRDLAFADQYRDPPLDVLQTHCNFPPTTARLEREIERSVRARERTGRPVWLSEWQRTRETPPDVLLPNYASLAPLVRASDLDGDFLWSLLLKPAYMKKPRARGRLNGVFHEDGVVYSRADARAIAGLTPTDAAVASTGAPERTDAADGATATDDPGGADAVDAVQVPWGSRFPEERREWPEWARAAMP